MPVHPSRSHTCAMFLPFVITSRPTAEGVIESARPRTGHDKLMLQHCNAIAYITFRPR